MTVSSPDPDPDPAHRELRARLGDRNIVFVGLMGAGKTVIGRKVAEMLTLPFADSDHEIEAAARMSISDLFAIYGEPEFRALEQRVIERLLSSGPGVISTGGGAFMNAHTRAMVGSRGVSVWLKADLDTLVGRVARRSHRPLLHQADPRAVMQRLMDERYPVYGEADVTLVSRNAHRQTIAQEAIEAVAGFLKRRQAAAKAGKETG